MPKCAAKGVICVEKCIKQEITLKKQTNLVLSTASHITSAVHVTTGKQTVNNNNNELLTLKEKNDV